MQKPEVYLIGDVKLEIRRLGRSYYAVTSNGAEIARARSLSVARKYALEYAENHWNDLSGIEGGAV